MNNIWMLNKNEFQELVNNSNSFRDILNTFNMDMSNGSIKTIYKRIEEENIDISFLEKNRNKQYSERGKKNKRGKHDIQYYLTENSNYGRSHLKSRLLNEHIFENKCSICNLEGMWNKKSITMILDHINGVNNDNRLENLRMVCPNCNSQLDTHAGRKNIQKHYCSCGTEKYKHSKNCKDCANKIAFNKQRKVERPPYEQLKKEIEETSYVSVGKKYGVSDNAIRKWIKYYEKHLG